jgi:uncharacterized RDD family membrane protein YckC
MNRDDAESAARAGAHLPRRLGAMLYDALLVLALDMLVTALLLPLTRQAILPATVGAYELAYQLLLIGVAVAFFGFFWTRRGQTLGMAAWRLKLLRDDGDLPTWRDTLVRLLAAVLSWLPCGLGYLWVLCDRESLAWHDRLSRTRVVLLPKR